MASTLPWLPIQTESPMAKKTTRPKSLNDIPESPDEMLVTKKMLDLGLAGVESKFTSLEFKFSALEFKFTALESKMEAGFSRLEGMIHSVAAETSRTLLLMEQQRSENRMFFEALGLIKD